MTIDKTPPQSWQLARESKHAIGEATLPIRITDVDGESHYLHYCATPAIEGESGQHVPALLGLKYTKGK